MGYDQHSTYEIVPWPSRADAQRAAGIVREDGGETEGRAVPDAGPIPSSPERILLFDNSVTDFCERYANQNEQDYQTFADAVRSGRLPAVEGV